MDHSTLRLNLQANGECRNTELQVDKERLSLSDCHGCRQVRCRKAIEDAERVLKQRILNSSRLLQDLVDARTDDRSAEVQRRLQFRVTRLPTGLHGPGGSQPLQVRKQLVVR